MAIAAEFETFLQSLSAADVEALALGATLPGRLVAAADHEGSEHEDLALAHAAAQGADSLGPAFARVLLPVSVHATAKLDADVEAAKSRLKQSMAVPASAAFGPLEAILHRARAVRARMPDAVREAFDDHVAHLMLHVAEASGGFLWWGEKISLEERQAARVLIDRLGVLVRDPDVRAKFKLD